MGITATSTVNEHIRMMQDKNYVYNMFRYELANHEYCVREEDEDTLQSLNLTIEDVNKNNLLKEQLMKAKKDYMAQY